MNSLKAFLNPIKVENKEVVISERFQENGVPVPFTIKPISQEENDALIKKHTKRDKKGNEVFDRRAYSKEMATIGVVFPDLQNTELQAAYGCLGAESLLQKMLLVGEYANLLEEIQKLSGLDVDINDDIDEAKN